MKKALTFLTLIIILSSCKKKKTFEVNTYPKKWELVKMSGNIPNSETTGNQML
nr:hypothetical protein [Pseudopedobacter sp.]